MRRMAMRVVGVLGVLSLTCSAVEEPFRVGVCGFAKSVCNEAGVAGLKDFGADFATGVRMTDRATLDLFQKYGLEAIVSGVVPGWWGGKTEWTGLMHEKMPLSKFAKAKQRYVAHPAVLQVNIGDEPGLADFAHYAKVVACINKQLPGVDLFLNLMPSYGSHIALTPADRLTQIGTSNYVEYIDQYCKLFPTQREISIDYYPYSAPAAELNTYLLRRLSDMAVVARACRQHKLRFTFYAQANSLFKELSMDLPRLRYQAFTALAFGVRRLIWTCYTPSWWENNILEKDGTKTPRWHDGRIVNDELHNLTAEFVRFRSTATRFIGYSPAEAAVLGEAATLDGKDGTRICDIATVQGGKLLIGEFVGCEDAGETAVLVAAADDPEGKNPRVRTLRFRAPNGVRAYGPKGRVTPKRVAGEQWELSLPADGAYFIIAPSDNPNMLKNAALASKDGHVPTDWSGSGMTDSPNTLLTADGVVRISEMGPKYVHSVGQMVAAQPNTSYCLALDFKSDCLSWKCAIRYQYGDERGRSVREGRSLIHPFYRGPQKDWTRLVLPIPPEVDARVKTLSISFMVYNDSRKPAADNAMYIRNPSLTIYRGQEVRLMPRAGSRKGAALAVQPFEGLPTADRPYRLECGAVAYLNMQAPTMPSQDGTRLALALPTGVTAELYLRRKGTTTLDRCPESAPNTFTLDRKVNWPMAGSVLLLAADRKAGERFEVGLTLDVGKEHREIKVPVEMIEALPPAPLPKTRRFRSWHERPVKNFTESAKKNPLARALAQYWQRAGLESDEVVNVTSAFPYRHDAKDPLAREGVAVHGTPTGIPCDSDLVARGAAYYCERLRRMGYGESLAKARYAVWDYEPYVVGPVTFGCYCADCRAAFAKELGLAQVPDGVVIQQQYKAEWVRFRCRQRAASVKVAVEGLKMLAPHIKFALCTMPMAPGRGASVYASDESYWETFGIDMPLYDDFIDVYRSMNYTPFNVCFDSLLREVTCLHKPNEVLLENGWGAAREGKRVGMQLAAAFFMGVERPYLAEGVNISDGDQWREIRRALQFVGATESQWERAELQATPSCKARVTSGKESRFWQVERKDKDGTRYVMVFNSAMDKEGPLTVELLPALGAQSQKITLAPCGWKLLTFRP